MATRREIIVLIVLILLIAGLVKLIELFKTNIVGADASKFVLEDLRSKYPKAEIEIMSITEKTNNAGEKYFEIKAKVTEDAFTPCPKRMHIYYNYPVQNFVPQPTEYITKNCTVCTEGTCTIAFPEEAIIASHTLPGTEEVDRFIKEKTTYPTVFEENNAWHVIWDSPSSTYYYIVLIEKDGKISAVEKMMKT